MVSGAGRSPALIIGGILAVILLLILVAVIIWESGRGSVVDGLRLLVTTPWGTATLVDLGIAFAVIGTWMWLLEPRPWARPLWLLALACLGSIATLVFLLARWRRASSLRDWLLERPTAAGPGGATP